MLEKNVVSLVHYGIINKKLMPTVYFIPQISVLIFSIFVLFGCAVKQPTIKQNIRANIPAKAQEVQVGQDIQNANIQPVQEKKFIVFFKTDFQGVLKTNYVKLTITPSLNPDKRIDLHLGDISNGILFKSGQKAIKPGYIYLELPEGEFRITSVSMLVGTTLASEGMNLSFVVKPDVANYLGTLSLNGTKEKIKLGGVPFIKPGFEFDLEIRDEMLEAENDFHRINPETMIPIHAALLTINKNDKT